MITKMDVPMSIFHRTRTVLVYKPDDYYENKKRYPVVYFQDGQNAFFDYSSYIGKSWGLLHYAQHYQWQVIIVAIYCNFEGFKRMDEYGPWPICEQYSQEETGKEHYIIGGEGKDYVKWMIEELKPLIDRRFATLPDQSAIVGSSMGAIISSYAALEFPEIFPKCASLSSAFWFYMDEFKSIIQSHTYSKDFSFYFDLGEFEGCGNAEFDQRYIESNEEIYALLKEKVTHLDYEFFEGASHNEMEWKKRVPLFMNFLFGEDI